MDSQKIYEKRYKDGYGTMYPDGHVIRFYEKFLKYELGINGSENNKILDYGCGNGTHPLYFVSKGFDVYGVDVSETAIEACKSRLSSQQDKYVKINPNQKFDNIFDCKFDIIISNQTLYYLSDSELADTMNQFDRILNDDGIVFFTMMGTNNFFETFAENEESDGLRKVNLKGRLNHSIKINFTKSEEGLKRKFSAFDPYFVGYYDISMREGSGFHYQFIGKKRK